MKEELVIFDDLVFTKGKTYIESFASELPQRAYKQFINGFGGNKEKVYIGVGEPTILDLSEVDPLGFIYLKNLGDSLIKTPNQPIITAENNPGLVTWGYKIVANQTPDANTIASPEGIVTNGNDTLTEDNYNFIQWLPVGGANDYDVYRTISGGTPTLLGWFANVKATNTFIDEDGITYVYATDTGFEGDGDAPPTFSPFDYIVDVGPDGISWPIFLRGGQSMRAPWNAPAVYVQARFNPTTLEQTILPE